MMSNLGFGAVPRLSRSPPEHNISVDNRTVVYSLGLESNLDGAASASAITTLGWNAGALTQQAGAKDDERPR